MISFQLLDLIVNQNVVHSSFPKPALPRLCVALINSHLRQSDEAKAENSWMKCLLLRGKESISASLNVKPLWLKKHTTHYACIRSLCAEYYGCGDREGTWQGRPGWEESLGSLTLEIQPPLSHI